MDFAKLEPDELASIKIAEHHLNQNEKDLLANECVKQQLKSKFNFKELVEQEKKRMNDLVGIELSTSEH